MSKPFVSRVIEKICILGMTLLLCVGMVPSTASAAVLNPAPAAKVSFTFDDGLASTSTQAAPTLAKYGLSGTSYVISGCVGMTTVPNTCRANREQPYMTWEQVQSLQNTYGWEIGSHTLDHKCLASNAVSDPDDCQSSTLTAAQVAAELSQSQADLAAHGITASDMAPPYGDYNNAVLAQIAKYYASMRGFKDQNDNVWPYNEYLLNDVPVQETVDTVASLEAKIDRAITNKQWLILSFHGIAPNPSQNPDDYEYGTAELDQVAAYVAAKQTAGLLSSVHINQGGVTSSTSLLPNGSFNNGIGDGWMTDNTLAIAKDTGTNGSYPDPLNAIKMISPASGTAHLFSPQVPVDPATTYLFKNFLNVQSISTGQVAFYVDEYDAGGNWIAGQYLKQENAPFVENMNFTYKPSSLAVAKASLQVIDGGSNIVAYLDNVQMFSLTSAPAPTNLVANGTFDNGIADGWQTDAPTTIHADAGNHGSPANPINSVVFSAAAANKHLFSPKVPVSAGHSYSLSSYLNLQSLGANEVGYYIDEYNASGNWISGAYVRGVRSVGAATVDFTYTPTSTSVASASLQLIVAGNSGANGYFDNVKWYQQ